MDDLDRPWSSAFEARGCHEGCVRHFLICTNGPGRRVPLALHMHRHRCEDVHVVSGARLICKRDMIVGSKSRSVKCVSTLHHTRQVQRAHRQYIHAHEERCIERWQNKVLRFEITIIRY